MFNLIFKNLRNLVMKRLFITLFSIISCYVSPVIAQNNPLDQDFLLDKDAIKDMPADENAIQKAEDSARRLLNQRPKSLRKQSFPSLRSKTKSTDKKVININNQSAPFGLAWGATIDETRRQGIELKRIELKDHPNSFSASKLPKEVADITRVDISFGDNNQLWRILAYGKLLDDTPNASKVLKMYNIYSALLEKKYGNKQEYFTPAQIDVTKKDERGKDIIVKEDAPLGNANFLSQLQSGEAVLYSTYQNKEVGAALAVNVDGDGKSYIVIDYKNLIILNKQEQETLDAL